MKSFSIIAIVMLIYSSQAIPCFKYIYNETKVGKGEVCSNWTNKGIVFNECNSDDLICMLPRNLEDFGLCAIKKEVALFLPGDHCETNEQCINSKKCENYVCIGKQAGEQCNANEECDVEMFCYKNKCTKVENDCTDGKKCASNKICDQGKCRKLGSIENGEKSNFASLCESYYVSNGICAEGPKLKKSSEDCLYTDGSSIYAFCRLSDDANTFCPPGEGEINIEYVNILMKYSILFTLGLL